MASAAAPAGTLPWAASCLAAYRPRNPRASSLYQLLDTPFLTLKRLWEERFECRYGFWQAYWDSAVFSYLDCGLFESGLARVVCPECRFEFLVAFSCTTSNFGLSITTSAFLATSVKRRSVILRQPPPLNPNRRMTAGRQHLDRDIPVESLVRNDRPLSFRPDAGSRSPDGARACDRS